MSDELDNRELTNVRDMVMRIDTNVINMAARAQEDREAARLLDKRVDKLENWQSRIGGIAVAISVAVGFMFSLAKEALAAIWTHH